MAQATPDLKAILASAATADPAVNALQQSDPARLTKLETYLASAFPTTDPAAALRFTQTLFNRYSLILKRGQPVAHEGPLPAEERLQLAQQEVDYTVLTHLARALYESTTGLNFEQSAQADPLPLLPGDHHHPGDLDPMESWKPNATRYAELLARWKELFAKLSAGDVAGTALASKHTALPSVLKVLARRGFSTPAENAPEGATSAMVNPDTAPIDPMLERSVQSGYCLFVAEESVANHVVPTSNRMLDPAAVVKELLEHRQIPAPAPQSILVHDALGQLTTELLSGPSAQIAEGLDTVSRGMLGAVLHEGILLGYQAGVQENRLTSPLPAGR